MAQNMGMSMTIVLKLKLQIFVHLWIQLNALLKPCRGTLFYPVKVPLLLIQVGSQGIGPLNINHEVLHLSLQPLLGLLQRGTLGVGGLDSLLSILETLSQLLPVCGQKRQLLSFLLFSWDLWRPTSYS